MRSWTANSSSATRSRSTSKVSSSKRRCRRRRPLPEHLGEDRFAIAAGCQRDDRPVAHVETDPRAALALEVDGIDERDCGAGGWSKADPTWDHVPFHQAAGHQLPPGAFSIFEVSRGQGAGNRWGISHRKVQARTPAPYSGWWSGPAPASALRISSAGGPDVADRQEGAGDHRTLLGRSEERRGGKECRSR